MDPEANSLEKDFTRHTLSKNDLCRLQTGERLIILSQKFPDTSSI